MESQANAPRRVLHFLESGGFYGAESVVLNLSREMRKTPGYVPMVGCIVQRPDEPVALLDKAREYGVEAYPVVINNKRFPLDILRFILKLRKLHVDVIHAHGYKASVVGFVARVLLRVPILPTCHLWFWGKDSPLKFRLMTGLEIFLYRYFKAITVVSQPIKLTLMERGVPGGRIHIIKNGINLDDFVPIGEEAKAKLRQELGIGPDTSVIINLGRLTEQKAHIDIIRTARLLKERGHRFVVLIVGDGELREELERQVREHGVEEEFRLLGFREDARALLQIADVFLLPSLDEGLPIALLEAMASHVPVIATPVGDVPEVLAEGALGALVGLRDPQACADAVADVFSRGQHLAPMTAAAHKALEEKYSASRMLGEYMAYYESL